MSGQRSPYVIFKKSFSLSPFELQHPNSHSLCSYRNSVAYVVQRPVQVPEAVQTMSAQLMEQMREKIQTALNADLVVVKDAYGDGRHVSIDVVSK